MNSLVLNAKQALTKVGGRPLLVLQKYSPELLMGLGIAGVITSTVLACKATLKSEAIIKKMNASFASIHEAEDLLDNSAYSKEDALKDRALAYTQTGIEFLKLYGPALLIGSLSIACLVGSHLIIKERNVAIMAAYKALDVAYNKYRERVVAELGAEKEQELRFNLPKKDKKGNIIVTKEMTEENKDLKPESEHSIYARFFDEYSPMWTKNADYNLMVINCQQDLANKLLHARKHIFLNEVYDSLGIPRSQAGAICGWVWDKDDPDKKITFGHYGSHEFINGYNNSVLLDFNVDGVIWDLI